MIGDGLLSGSNNDLTTAICIPSRPSVTQELFVHIQQIPQTINSCTPCRCHRCTLGLAVCMVDRYTSLHRYRLIPPTPGMMFFISISTISYPEPKLTTALSRMNCFRAQMFLGLFSIWSICASNDQLNSIHVNICNICNIIVIQTICIFLP